MKIDLQSVEETARDLYIRALKLLPTDIKQGLVRLKNSETNERAQGILSTMMKNVDVAEANDNLLCQDTGIPIYNVSIGRGVEVDGAELRDAIIKGCERATLEHPLRSSIVHPITRFNEQTSCGIKVPVVNFDFTGDDEELVIEMIPKGSGSENG
ncbi:MAG: fumarate hydratase, partial [Rhodospirillales bacterium]|nr:fumarate hydratase [Rhodospirillales bacterium]